MKYLFAPTGTGALCGLNAGLIIGARNLPASLPGLQNLPQKRASKALLQLTITFLLVGFALVFFNSERFDDIDSLKSIVKGFFYVFFISLCPVLYFLFYQNLSLFHQAFFLIIFLLFISVILTITSASGISGPGTITMHYYKYFWFNFCVNFIFILSFFLSKKINQKFVSIIDINTVNNITGF